MIDIYNSSGDFTVFLSYLRSFSIRLTWHLLKALKFLSFNQKTLLHHACCLSIWVKPWCFNFIWSFRLLFLLKALARIGFWIPQSFIRPLEPLKFLCFTHVGFGHANGWATDVHTTMKTHVRTSYPTLLDAIIYFLLMPFLVERGLWFLHRWNFNWVIYWLIFHSSC